MADNTRGQDLTSLSKEELIELLLKRERDSLEKEKESSLKISAMVNNLRAVISQKDASLKASEDEKQKLIDEKEKLKAANDSLNKTNKTLNAANDSLNKTNKTLNAHNAGLEKTNVSLKELNASLEKTNVSLKELNTSLEKTTDSLKEQIKKLKKFRQTAFDLINNVLANIRNYYFVFKDLKADDIPQTDDRNMLEVNMFLEQKITVLLNTALTFLEHQRKALNLPRSEKTPHSEASDMTADNSADIQAQADGALEIQKEVTVQPCDNDAADFDEASSSVTISADTDEAKATDDKPQEDAVAVLMSGCSASKPESVAAGLTAGTAVLSMHTVNDTKSLNDSHRKRKYDSFISVNNSNQVAGVISGTNGNRIALHCPQCGKVQEFVILSRLKRVNSILTADGSLNSVKTVLAKVQDAECTRCGTRVEINPVAKPEFSYESVHNKERFTLDVQEKNAIENAKNVLNQSLTDTDESDKNESLADDRQASYKQDNKARQKDRKQIYKDIVKCDDTTSHSFSLNDNLMDAGAGLAPVINPYFFDAETFGVTPAFLKSVMSVSFLSSCGTLFSQLGAPKNRVYNFYEGNGLPLTREQTTAGLNAFARAFLHGVALTIHDDILRYSSAVVCDESTLLCRENSYNKHLGNGGSKSQIWVMTSGFTSPVKAAWYTVSPGRCADNVVDILKDGCKKDGPLKYVISDGYAGYDSGINTLEEITGIKLKSCRCWAHARRGLWKLLLNKGLISVYGKELLPTGCAFSCFEDNLQKYRQTKAGKKLKDNDVSLLTIFYLINALFVIDSEVIKAHQYVCDTEEFKKDLLKARKEKSAKIVDLIFDCIRLYVADNKDIMSVKKTTKGEYTFIRNRSFPESGALIYLLKFEKALKEFITSPDIELTSSAAERALKLGICTRHACMFIQSEDGAQAFADYQTIVNTCNLNRVPVQHYMMWLTANIRQRLLKMQNEGHSDATFFSMPHKTPVKDKDGKITEYLNMYDKKNKICYDKVDTRGLAPYDYRRYLEMQDHTAK